MEKILEEIEVTSAVIQTKFRGVTLQAFGAKGARYTGSVVESSGRCYFTSFGSVTDARVYFATHENLSKMVLYSYFPKARKFKVKRFFERQF